MECSASSSLGSYSGYFGTGKNSEIPNSGQEHGLLNQLTRNAPLRLQLGGQYPYLPYNVNLLNDTKFQPAAQMNQQEDPLEYHVSGNFGTSRPGYETTQHGWASTSGSSAVNMFDEHLYHQVKFSSTLVKNWFLSCMLLAAFECKVYLFVDWSLLEILVKKEGGGGCGLEASTLLPFKFCYMLHKVI